MKADEVKNVCGQVAVEVEKAIIGKRSVVERVIAAMLCDGHVLFEDFPGLAKTMLAKSTAAATGCVFKRVQFTSDLMPADITGTYVLNPKSGSFELRRGPVFTNVLLADEINRAPPKTQSALLEAMQERQVTLEGESQTLQRPFVVLATQNPIEYEGTYPLPEAQIDRFLMKLSVGYPEKADEIEILKRRKARGKDEPDIAMVASAQKLLEMQAFVETVHIDPSIMEYCAEITRKTRGHGQVEIGASPRGSLALMRLSCAMAAMAGRDYVLPDDVKSIAVEALAHRIILKPDPWIKGIKAEVVVQKVLEEVPVPKVK
ncbi:MAG: MoxR family ATPase [Methanobacteriota archaeon]